MSFVRLVLLGAMLVHACSRSSASEPELTRFTAELARGEKLLENIAYQLEEIDGLGDGITPPGDTPQETTTQTSFTSQNGLFRIVERKRYLFSDGRTTSSDEILTYDGKTTRVLANGNVANETTGLREMGTRAAGIAVQLSFLKNLRGMHGTVSSFLDEIDAASTAIRFSVRYSGVLERHGLSVHCVELVSAPIPPSPSEPRYTDTVRGLHRLYFRTDRGMSPAGYESFVASEDLTPLNLETEMVIDTWQQVEGVFLPETWHVNGFAPLRWSRTGTLKDVALNPDYPSSYFSVDFPESAVVYDVDKDGGIPSSGASGAMGVDPAPSGTDSRAAGDIRGGADSAISGASTHDSPSATSRRFLRGLLPLLAACCAALLFAGAYYPMRKRRN